MREEVREREIERGSERERERQWKERGERVVLGEVKWTAGICSEQLRKKTRFERQNLLSTFLHFATRHNKSSSS